MNQEEQRKYEKILRQNEKLKQEIMEIKSFNFEKIAERIQKEEFVEEVLSVHVKTLENRISALIKENELLKTSLKKQFAKNLYNIITLKK